MITNIRMVTKHKPPKMSKAITGNLDPGKNNYTKIHTLLHNKNIKINIKIDERKAMKGY